MSGEVRLSEGERAWLASGIGSAHISGIDVLYARVERILAARLAAVPVPSDTGLAAAVEAWIDDAPAGTAGLDLLRQIITPEPRALLSERTATTGGGGA